jgi:hypothetical protein
MVPLHTPRPYSKMGDRSPSTLGLGRFAVGDGGFVNVKVKVNESLGAPGVGPGFGYPWKVERWDGGL